MREILLSFKPEIFDLIRTGKKIYEYRYQFSDDESRAYMYVSKPVQQIVGYIELSERISLEVWKNKYNKNKEVLERIETYISRNNKYVMEIRKFCMINPISLIDIKKNVDNFVIPQSYYYLDNCPELHNYIKKNVIETNEIIENGFEKIKMKDICVLEYK